MHCMNQRKSITKSITFPKEVLEKIEEQAMEDRRTFSDYCRKLIAEGIEKYERKKV